MWCTVYPKKYAHGFCFAVLCCGYTLTDFPISIRLTSLALWQSNDCPSASKATLMNMDKYFMWIHYERFHNHNKAKHNETVCIFLGIYCTSVSKTGLSHPMCTDELGHNITTIMIIIVADIFIIILIVIFVVIIIANINIIYISTKINDHHNHELCMDFGFCVLDLPAGTFRFYNRISKPVGLDDNRIHVRLSHSITNKWKIKTFIVKRPLFQEGSNPTKWWLKVIGKQLQSILVYTVPYTVKDKSFYFNLLDTNWIEW